MGNIIEYGMAVKSDWYRTFFDGLYTDVLGNHGSEDGNEAEALLVKRLLKARKGNRVLDVGCGMGRLTLPLSRLGLNMTGVDLTARYVRKARQKARAADLEATFIERDMRNLDFEGEFDAAFCWFTTFGYFSKRGNLAAVRKMYAALKPGGRLLIELSNKSWILSHFQAHSEVETAGVRVTEERRYNARSGRMISTWTLSKGRRKEVHKASLQMFSGAELRTLLRQAGFASVTLYGRPPLGRLTRHSMRLLAIAEKGR